MFSAVFFDYFYRKSKRIMSTPRTSPIPWENKTYLYFPVSNSPVESLESLVRAIDVYEARERESGGLGGIRTIEAGPEDDADDVDRVLRSFTQSSSFCRRRPQKVSQSIAKAARTSNEVSDPTPTLDPKQRFVTQ